MESWGGTWQITLSVGGPAGITSLRATRQPLNATCGQKGVMAVTKMLHSVTGSTHQTKGASQKKMNCDK